MKNPAYNTFILLWIPVLLWMLGIFYLSSFPGNGTLYEMPKIMLLERKGAHVFEYFILTLLFIRVLILSIPNNIARVLWLSFFLTLLYAISDEVHQLFVFGRTGKAMDVLIDSMGMIGAVLLFYLKPSWCMNIFFSKTQRLYLPLKEKKHTMKMKK